MLNKNVHVVLCKPLYPRNIGQCARAMSNLGFEKLILIEGPNLTPEEEFEARQGAARGQDPWQNAHWLKSWDEFYEHYPEGKRIGFSRRAGELRPLSLWLNFLKQSRPQSWLNQPIYLVFGSEDRGLETEDLARVHHICELPVWGATPSYNLSHAVLAALFSLRQKMDEAPEQHHSISEKTSNEITKTDAHFFPDEILQEWIEVLGFTIENRSVNALSVLKRLLLRNEPTVKELRILEAVIFQTVRKLKEKKL